MVPIRKALPPLSLAIASGVAFGYLADLVWMAIHHQWILDSDGHPRTTDFLSFWTAGRLALSGDAADAYDWSRMHALQAALMGHDPGGFLGWAYPPLFFLPVMPLALMPYAMAFLTWLAVTGALYTVVVARAAGPRAAALLALAVPATLASAIVGQNGFLTAAIMGAALLAIDERPLLAGLLLGLLTYKPHFGLLFPIALVLGGYGRAFFAAVAASVLIVLLSWLVAPESLAAFAAHLGGMSHDFLTQGSAGFYKLQSLYGLMRTFGYSDTVAFLAQAMLLLAMATFVAFLWRSDAPLSRKCAGLCAATLLATPYLFLYDFPILALAIAFLWRERAFDRTEITLLLFSQLALALFAVASMPLGLAASVLTFIVIVRRGLKGAVPAKLQPQPA